MKKSVFFLLTLFMCFGNPTDVGTNEDFQISSTITASAEEVFTEERESVSIEENEDDEDDVEDVEGEEILTVNGNSVPNSVPLAEKEDDYEFLE